jgi:hypothetical protein
VTDDGDSTATCQTTADIVFRCIQVDTEAGDQGEALTFQAEVLGGCSVGSADLLVRKGGQQGTFTRIPLSRQGDQLSATVPATLVTERGIEYYIEAGTLIEPPDGEANPAFLPVSIPNLVQAPVPTPEQYVMIGLPLVATPSDPAIQLVDDLDTYDPHNWRLFRFVPAIGDYREFPATGGMDAGRGFWLIERSPVAVDASGTSTNSRTGVSNVLPVGWSQIANPFAFPVDWSTVDRSPNVADSVVAFADGGYRKQTRLEPWQGYWTFNGGTQPESIRIRGVEAAAPRAGAPLPPAAAPAPALWQIAVTAVQGQKWDGPNIAAAVAEASPGADPRDEHEPPPAPEHVTAWFVTTAMDGDETMQHLRIDARPEPARGAEWELVVSALDPREPVARLDWGGLRSVPERFEVWLLESAGAGAWDLRRQPRIAVPAGRLLRYRLVVGTPDYLDEVRERQPAATPRVRVTPNPFSTETAFEFTLPDAAAVSLRIYDATGRLVETLVDSQRGPGPHVAIWPGHDTAGRAVPSGMYFYRLTTGETAVSGSLLLVR